MLREGWSALAKKTKWGVTICEKPKIRIKKTLPEGNKNNAVAIHNVWISLHNGKGSVYIISINCMLEGCLVLTHESSLVLNNHLINMCFLIYKAPLS